VTHGKKNLQMLITGAVVAFAVAAPAAQASPAAEIQVCNQATHNSLGGNLLATDGDKAPAARFKSSLKAHPGKGAGLVNAASHSSALSACVLPTGETPGGGDPVVVPPVGGDNGYIPES